MIVSPFPDEPSYMLRLESGVDFWANNLMLFISCFCMVFPLKIQTTPNGFGF